MSDGSSTVLRYLRRKAIRRIVAKVGTAKLLAIGAAVAAAFLVFLVLLAALVGATTDANAQGAQSCVGKEGTDSPPPKLVPIYAKAAERFGLGPRGAGILAAINSVESHFGRLDAPGVRSGSNFAGAEGPMQFLSSTWEAFKVDGDGDGDTDVFSPADAIFGAANLLRTEGAPEDWSSAIFQYNHADWYVREVEEIARSFGTIECTGQLGSLPSAPAQRLTYVAQWIEAQRLPYCWGGGHGSEPGPSGGISYCWNAAGEQVYGSAAKGLDCSGAVRWLLVLAGYPDPGGIGSGGFADLYEPGPGAEMTIWANAEHVFIEIAGADWGTSGSNFAHGPGFAEHTTDGFVARHLEGL